MPRIAAGIYLTELDFTDAALQLGVTRLCVVGGASKGPVNIPTVITSEAELVETFGPPLTNDLAIISAIQFLQKGNNLVFLRVAHTGDYETADYPIPGTTGGTAAVAATGEVRFIGQVLDGDLVVVNDGQAAIAASGTVTFTGGTQPGDGDTVHMDDGAGVAAAALLTFTATPLTADLLTITDGDGNTDIYEFTAGGGSVNIEVDKSATTDAGASELRAAMIASGTANITPGAVGGGGPWTVMLTNDATGTSGNAGTIAASGANPTYAAFAGGDNAITLEFESGGGVAVGHVSVAIGATTPDTLATMIQEINGQQVAGNILVTSADTTGVGDPQATVTHDQPGTVGNAGTMTSAGATPPAVTALSGGSAGGSTTFEMDSNGTYTPGNVPVLIGADSAASCVNLINAINGSVLAVGATYDSVTIPKAMLTNTVPGDAGNQTITESTSAARMTVVGMTGGIDAIAGAVSTVFTTLANSPGTWGNAVQVQLQQTVTLGAPSVNFDLFVLAPIDNSNTIGIVEKFYNLSLVSTSDRYAETIIEEGKKGEVNASKYVEIDVLELNATVTPGTYTLGTGGGTVGTDGIDTLVYSDYVGTVSGLTATGLQALLNPEAVEFNLLAVPGITHWAVIDAAIALAVTRGDFFYCVDDPYDLSVEEAIDWHNGEGGLHGIPNPPTAPIESSYAGVGHAWSRVYDQYNKVNVWVPPSAIMSAEFADNDNQRGPWMIAAGETRGVFEKADGVTYSPSPADRRQMTEGQNRVNPIVVMPQIDGVMVYGNRTLLRTESYLSDIHIRRMMLYAEKLCAIAVRKIVFDPNDPITWKKFEMLCNPILASIAAGRGLEEFQVIADSTTTTEEMRGERRMKGKLRLVPVPGAEAIDMEFSLFRTGADFEEVA